MYFGIAHVSLYLLFHLIFVIVFHVSKDSLLITYSIFFPTLFPSLGEEVYKLGNFRARQVLS